MSYMPMSIRHCGIMGAVWSGALVAALASAPTVLAADWDAPLGRDIITSEQQSIANTPMPPSSIAVSAWFDRQNGRYAIGDSVQLWLQVNQPAYLTVLNVGTTGRVTQVFPNAFVQNNFVQANQTLQIPGTNAPYRLSFEGPPGTELIKVIASSQPVKIIPPGGSTQAGVFTVLDASPDQVSRDIITAVNQSPQVSWSQVNKPLYVAANGQERDLAVGPSVPAGTPPAGGPATAFSLRVSTDQPAYRIGQAIQVFVTSDRTCSLTLLDVGSSGNVSVLFPNRRQSNNLIQAGQTLVLPGPMHPNRFTLGGPPGQERLIAVCRTDGQTAFNQQITGQAQEFAQLGGVDAVAQDLAVTASQAPAVQAMTEISFVVIP